MIKLVSQFDNEKTEVSLATPTCGGCCCCCCCCVISTIVSANISARSFGTLVEKKYPNDKEKIISSRKFGFCLPIGMFLILLPFISLLLFNVYVFLILCLISEFIYLFFMVRKMKEKLNISGIVLKTIGSVVSFICIEILGAFMAAMMALDCGVILIPVYFIFAIAFSIHLIKDFMKENDDINCGTNNIYNNFSDQSMIYPNKGINNNSIEYETDDKK